MLNENHHLGSRPRWLATLLVVLAFTSVSAAAGAAPPAGAPAVESAPSSLTGVSPELPAGVIAASSAPGSGWKPEKAIYGTASINDIAVQGADGTTIRVNEIYPTTASGKPAPGKFPVLLTMTPYGKGQGGSSKPGSAATPGGGAATGGADNYLVQRGYIEVVEDVRGTGDSGGSFGLFDPIQTQDAIKVLNWAAHLSHSNGRVGTYGPSYLGIDQLLLAGAVGPNSPLKATFPMVPANDIYRDTSFMGGLLDAEFDMTYLGLTTALNTITPVTDTTSDPTLLSDLGKVSSDHANSASSYVASLTAGILSGGDPAYDQSYWLPRDPQTYLKQVAANHIPAYIVGGEFDIFQRGEPIDYAELQNAWSGRSSTAPMLPGQRTTGRYQLIDGPWEHINGSSVDVDPIELEWFDTWLKNETTGMARTPTPLHYYDLGTGRFDETTTFPFTGPSPTRFYLGAGGTLASSRPSATAGSDTITWSPVGNACGRSVDQWSMGGVSIPSNAAGLMAPCASNDQPSHVGPWTTSYTSAPFNSARTVGGPIAADIFATSTTPDTQLVAELEEVTPDGSSFPLTEGALLGSLRATDASRSWTQNGLTLLPYHPYTQASAQAVTPGAVTEYRIEIFPTLATIAKGDRLRLTLSTADTPHLTPIPPDLPKLSGGVYAIQRTASSPSSLTLDLGQVKGQGPAGSGTPSRCPVATGSLTATRLGVFSLGMTRTRARRLLPRLAHRGRSDEDVFCLRPIGIRAGYGSARVTRGFPATTRRRLLGHIVLLLSANRHYALRRVRPDTRLSSVAKRIHLGRPMHIGLNTWYVLRGGTSDGIFKVRHGMILEVGIANSRLSSTRARARHLLAILG